MRKLRRFMISGASGRPRPVRTRDSTRLTNRRRPWRSHAGIAVAAVCALTAAGFAAFATAPASAASACTAAYSVTNQWNTGFQASVTV
ncbi:MAG: hypothetical protein JOY82_03095, partial [Streptosporangiaceae bacterium]|nr:hypothetical protein [Streptosporangiaceae bacterium]